MHAPIDDALFFFFKLMNSSSWIEFIGDRGICTTDDAKNCIQNSLLDNYKNRGYGLYKVDLKNAQIPIGVCGFVKRDYLEYIDNGFAILPKFEGKGYTSEAAKAVMQYGMSKLKVSTIFGITTENNKISKKILLKVGLKQIGTIRSKGNDSEAHLFLNSEETKL